ncbi:MAG: methyltransferase domain-containing protein [Candidatus Zixiibacteriota bacterium]
MNIDEQMERIYRDIPPEKIPWNMPHPPDLLVEAVKQGKIKPCRMIDLGCGAGNYSVWFAQQGFDVTGVDISKNAIALATGLAASKGAKCKFIATDLLGDLSEFHSSFDFAFDWEVLHHIAPENRSRYLENVHGLLRSDGIYFSLCFSDKDIDFSGG